MPLPANVTTVTVLGTFLTPEGDPSTGTVSFTPSSWLLNSGANIAIPNSSVVKTLGTAGDFTAVLPITDDPDLSPGGWVYSVSEVVDGVSQSYNIAIPGTVAAGGTVFLADLAPVAPAGPEYYSLASSLAIGTVSTVPTGGSATASITGLAPSQVLNLGIPVGATGTVASAGSGSVGTAAVAPQGDPDTGIYFPAANQVAITTGGSAAATFAAGAISNPTFTGVAQFPDGSASAPSITNTGDTNTGIFHPAEDTVSISTGGTERLRVTSAGDVGIGTTVPSGSLDVYRATSAILSVRGDSATQMVFRRASTDATGAQLFIDKLRGTQASPSIVSSGDTVGRIQFRGYDGSSFQNLAEVRAEVDGAPGASDMPGRLNFYTTADGSATITERMRIDSNGLITGTGTSLGAWTAFTPSWTNLTLGTGATNSGFYCQIGKIVHFIIWTTLGTSGASVSGRISCGLPVNNNGGRGADLAQMHGEANDASTGKNYRLRPSISSNTVFADADTVDGSYITRPATSSTVPFTWDNGDAIRISGTYQAA